MVGLVIVSHSQALSASLDALLRQVSASDIPVRSVGGIGAGRNEFGTDAVDILGAIEAVWGAEGAVVLVDLGSAVLSAETALEMLPPERRSMVRICAAPLVEGAIAAGVRIGLGDDLEAVCREARQALDPKIRHLEATGAGAVPGEAPADTREHPLPEREITLTINSFHGLHARPAARFVQTAGGFDARVRVRKLGSSADPVAADSFNSLVTLGVRRGERIAVSAEGPEANQALKALATLIDEPQPLIESPPTPSSQTVGKRSGGTGQGMAVVALSEGIALGPVFQYRRQVAAVSHKFASNPDHEWARLLQAIDSACDAMGRRRQEMAVALGKSRAAIFDAHLLIARDPVLLQRVRQLIFDTGENATWAWRQGVDEICDAYRTLDDDYLGRRADDVADVGRQVMDKLLGSVALPAPELPQSVIVVAEDLSPTDVVALNAERVLGIVTRFGGPTSHSAILARGMGIPAVAGAPAEVLDLPAGTQLGLDGFGGFLWIRPSAEDAARMEALRLEWQRRRRRLLRAGQRVALTTDGRKVRVAANIAGVTEAEKAFREGADGVGLLRTEFLFLKRDAAPTEAEQLDALRRIVDAAGEKPVCVRTLDAGGDKPLPYLRLRVEANPCLGVRGARLALLHPEIFRTQLRAILRAGAFGELRLMFPMIARTREVERLLTIRDAVHRELEKEHLPHRWPIPTGIMIETPAAALIAGAFAERVDFFSVGTNDLTQYTLAAERGHPQLADYADPLHPAILRLIRQVVEGAHRQGKPVTVCGEMAADPEAVIPLVGLGVDELSMVSARIAEVKDAVQRSSFGDAARLAEKMLELNEAGEVRRLAVEYLTTIFGADGHDEDSPAAG